MTLYDSPSPFSTARTTPNQKSLSMLCTTIATLFVRRSRKFRACSFRVKPRRAANSVIRSRVFSATLRSPFSASETVAGDTFSSSAISYMVIFIPCFHRFKKKTKSI